MQPFNYKRAVLFIINMCVCLSCPLTGKAQCSGISLSGYNGYLALSTYSELLDGKTASPYLTLAYNLPYNTNCSGWKLTVRVSGNFTNGASTIEPQYFSVQFNNAEGGPLPSAIPMPTSPIPLSTTETILVAQSNAALQAPPDYYFTHRFNLIVQGGSHLFAPTGLYCTNLIVTLYDQGGNQVTTTSIPLTFYILYAVTCSQTSLSSFISGTGAQFTTYTELQNGITASQYINLAYSTPSSATCPGWKLTVTASGNFISGGEEVPLRYASIRFNSAEGGPPPSSIPMPASPIPLSTTETTLVAQSDAAIEVPPDYYFTHRFDLIIQGGAHLFVPDGTYTTNLMITFYDIDGNQVSTTSTPISFQINYQGSGGGSSLTLTDGGNLVNFNYAALSDHRTGVTVSKPASLYVTAYSNYQVIVQTVDADFTSSSTSYTFPVSVIALTAALDTSSPSSCGTGVTCYSVNLSSSGQTLISNANTNYPCQQLYYDLTYATQPNDTKLFFAPAGSYTASLLLVIVPL